ncbi:hypothetical protein [Nonomuraea maritima]|uniref:hypothetical protein n=1 Tax=Nonomuraea maritima TaxID=683260 RepID=UPI00371C2FEC
MSLSDVIRNIARTVTNKDQLKEKAKDLPLLVVQGTLSAAGQALLVVDRMKNSVKGLGRKDEEREASPSAAEQVAEASVETAEDKPARKEPVIFTPRSAPAEPEQSPGTAIEPEAEPVATTPAAKAEPTPTAEPEPEPKPEPAVATEKKPAEAPAEKPAEVAAETPAEKPAEVAAEAPAETVAEKPAKKPVAKPAKKVKAAEATPEPAGAAPAEGGLVEPLPGYASLTVASLRARMRGKTAEQIGDYLAYEKATTARPEVVKMFENRLAKLEAEKQVVPNP